jgi:hypothetical protein
VKKLRVENLVTGTLHSMQVSVVVQAYYSYTGITAVAQFGGWAGLLLGIRKELFSQIS